MVGLVVFSVLLQQSRYKFTIIYRELEFTGLWELAAVIGVLIQQDLRDSLQGSKLGLANDERNRWNAVRYHASVLSGCNIVGVSSETAQTRWLCNDQHAQ